MADAQHDPPPESVETRAGRGFLWLTAAKLHFMLAGWAVYFILPRLMDDVGWGRFLSVLFLVSILNNLMVTSAVQGVSRFTAAAPERAWTVLRGGLTLFLIVGGLCAGALWLGAPFIAAAHADASLAPLYRAAALIAFAYAVYATCVGSVNGRQRFGTQAGFDATYATLRLGLMVAGALLLGRTLAARGAYFGYSAAALLICAGALLVVALPLRRRAPAAARQARVEWGPLILFVLPVALHQLGINLMMRSDALLVKALGGHLAGAGEVSADVASVLAGRYGTGMVFALVPYQALIALAMVVFPLVADAAAADRPERLHRTTRAALRFAALFGAGLAALLAAQPANVIDLVYPASYREAGVALQFQAWGVIGLSLLTLSCAVLNATGRTWRVIGLTLGTWVVQAGVIYAVIRAADSPAALLGHTALANAGVLLLGAGAALLTVRLSLGVPLPGLALLRAGVAAAGATLVGRLVAGPGVLLTLVTGAVGAAVYLAILVATRELTGGDLATVARMLRRRG